MKFLEDHGSLIYCDYTGDDDDIMTYKLFMEYNEDEDEDDMIDKMSSFTYAYIPHEPICVTSAHYNSLNTCPIPSDVPTKCQELEDIGFTKYKVVFTLRLDEDR